MLKSSIGVLMASVLMIGVTAVATARGASNDLRTSPIMHSVAPGTVKAGGQVVATGENLGKAAVAQVYLTTGKVDTKHHAVQQNHTTL